MTPEETRQAAAVKLPDNLPPLPPVPRGYTRWQIIPPPPPEKYKVLKYLHPNGLWIETDGVGGNFYHIEAVRDQPAESAATGVEARVCEDVIEMALCEVPRVMLRPNQLYRFVVMPACAQCKSDAAPYSETPTTEGHE